MYKLLVGEKIRFLDDILYFLESTVNQQNEDVVASACCYNSKIDRLTGVKEYSFKRFLPTLKERLYLRVAMLHLEKEGFITKHPNLSDIEIPLYLISYSGIILVENGGYCKSLVLNRLKEILQRLAWFVTLLALLLNAYVYKDRLISSKTSEPSESSDTSTK